MSDFRIRIQAELDAKNFTSQIDALKKNKIKIPVELDLKNTDLQKALSGLSGKSSKVKIDADTSAISKASEQVTQMKKQLSTSKFQSSSSFSLTLSFIGVPEKSNALRMQFSR